MSSSTTHNLMAQYYLAYHENNIDRMTNIFSNKYVGEINGEEVNKKEAIKNIASFMESFPNVKFTVHDSFQAGKKIASRWTCTGSHWGQFQGIPPTDTVISITGMTIFEVSKTQIERIWTNYDLNALLEQLKGR